MNDKAKLLIKIAKLYYESGLTQDAISNKLRMSRPRVSRLMQEAIDSGIVKFTIAQEPSGFTELENLLESKFDLFEVVVVNVANPDSADLVAKELGAVAADFFNRLVLDGDTVGFTWGVTLAAMVENLKQEKKNNVTILQMVGGLGEPGSETHDVTGLVSRTAMAINGTVCLMPSPGVVASVDAAKILKSDRYISQTLEKLKDVDIAFVSIGAPTPTSLLMRDESIISRSEMNSFIKAGAVGDISLHFFDVYGKEIQTELDNRIIGISLDEIKKINRVVGIAGGSNKFEAILGAIRGKYINTLITDQLTAKRLVELNN